MAITKLLIAGLLSLATSATAFAIPFAGTYEVNLNTNGSGLIVEANPSSGSLAFNLNVGQATGWFSLFSISTPESSINSDDIVPVAASIDFDFVMPTSFNGTSSGATNGLSFAGIVQTGVLTWANSGLNSLTFGTSGILDVYLQDVYFGTSLFGLSSAPAAVKGKFFLRQADVVAVPEPGTLTLFGIGLVTVAFIRWRRSSRNSTKR